MIDHILTWGIQDGDLCFYINGKIVKRADRYALASLIKNVGQAIAKK